MINSVVKVKMNSFHFEFHGIDLVVLFVLCTICKSKISERNENNKGPFTWRKEDPSTGRSHKAEQLYVGFTCRNCELNFKKLCLYLSFIFVFCKRINPLLPKMKDLASITERKQTNSSRYL